MWGEVGGLDVGEGEGCTYLGDFRDEDGALGLEVCLVCWGLG